MDKKQNDYSVLAEWMNEIIKENMCLTKELQELQQQYQQFVLFTVKRNQFQRDLIRRIGKRRKEAEETIKKLQK